MNKLPSTFYIVILAVFFSITFYNGNPTAFTWPAIDMAPFFERSQDQQFLPNDFFTNASMDTNPRQVYGTCIIFLSNLFHTGWYSIFFSLHTCYFILTPCLIFLLIWPAVKPAAAKEYNELYVGGILTIALMFGYGTDFQNYFSIAWWPAYSTGPTSQNFSFFVFLLGAGVRLYMPSKWNNIYVLFWFVAILAHFAMGVFFLVFFLILYYNQIDIKKIALDCGAVLLALLILLVFYTGSNTLSSADFIRIYTNRHAHHYIPEQFGTLTNLPWWYSFSFNVVYMLGALFLAWRMKSSRIMVIATLFIATYAGAVVLQWIAVGLVPSKFIVALGPVRYSMFGYYMLIILSTSIVSLLTLPTIKQPAVLTRVPAYLLGILPLLVASLAWCKSDDPNATMNKEDRELYAWIKQNTPATSTITAPFTSNYCMNIPIFCRRAIFVGNGFPFSENHFIEFENRHNALFNQNASTTCNSTDCYDKSYYSLTPSAVELIRKKYAVDYLLFDKTKANGFSNLSPCYESENVILYAMPKK